MTFTPNSLQLLTEQTVTGSAVTDVDITNLDMVTDKHYRLDYMIYNPTGSTADYYIYVNGDYTATHYSCSLWNWSSTTAVGQNNNPEFSGQVISSAKCCGFLEFYIDPVGYFRFTGTSSRGTNAAGSGTLAVGNKYDAVLTNSNITSIRIHSTIASAIGIGSIFRLCRISP